jgi:adenylylsulfate kinase-like enzyme
LAYEVPTNADLVIDTAKTDLATTVGKIKALLVKRGIVPE